MSRYRMYPDPVQEQQMLTHCAHARYVWNLAVEQLRMRHHRQRWTNPVTRSQQLTEARREFGWLRAGSVTVQQQALRDFDRAVNNWNWWRGPHAMPTWRKREEHEGFRVVNGRSIQVQQLNGRWSQVLIPKVGWVRFRRTRPVPDARSFRVKRDHIGRWHIAFAAIPVPIEGPCDQSIIGIDRGVVVTFACSDGTAFQAPRAHSTVAVQRKLCRAKRGSGRRALVKETLAKLHSRNNDRRKDFIEKASTTIARTYDLIRIEDLRVVNMTRSARGTVEMPGRNVRAKAGLNRAILNGGWGMFARRLQDKAPGRVEKVNPAFTSQRCSVCGHVVAESRKSQALFACVACGHTSNADLNAARNIAAGHAVTARGAPALVEAMNREPQHAPLERGSTVGIPRPSGGGCQLLAEVDFEPNQDDLFDRRNRLD